MRYYISEINLCNGEVFHTAHISLEKARSLVQDWITKDTKNGNTQYRYLISSESIPAGETERYLQDNYLERDVICTRIRPLSPSPEKHTGLKSAICGGLFGLLFSIVLMLLL